eukprot:20821-Heterococcus_DN1.PRE.1
MAPSSSTKYQHTVVQSAANDVCNAAHTTAAQPVHSSILSQDVYQAVIAVVRPGDEVIIPAPYWPSYPEIVRMAGGTPVIIETGVEEGFLLSKEALKAAITPKTRMLIFCNPSNPTGAVHDRQRCEELSLRLALAQALLTEPVRAMLKLTYYYEVALPSILMRCMKERTLLVNGFSKSHAMTGYRMGYLDFVLSRLQRIPDVKVATPQGAFYVLPDVSAYYGKSPPDGSQVIDGATTLCLYLLRAHKVALVTGEGFGYPKGVRLSYATSMEDLTTALDQFESCLLSLK